MFATSSTWSKSAICKAINLEELYCIECYSVDYPRLEHPGPSLRLQRLVLDSTLLPTTIPAPLLPELTHLALINVEGRSAASFTRDAWLAEFAPQLTSCALTLVGSGWHSDLPIIRAMKKIRVLDLFIPNAVGLPVATILGPSPIDYAIGSTIEYLRIEMTSYRFNTFVTWAQENPPPNKLRYLGLRIQESVQEDARDNLLRVWARVKIEMVVVGRPEDRRREEGYEELFWDQVERGDFDRITITTPTSQL
ncbi:BQ2448_4013 [Microbotryum intermedium]|uniref:BQ2448_4013 protein n=1 Tax=Microbotryum intermedium TaxID=269621 RepID=A0A238FN19_9BASI|nr:BQ2448_4013 [Microbotryum intermedium]